MAKFNVNDKVKIINTGDVWEGKTGKVISESSEEIITEDGRDLTEVTVKVSFNVGEETKSIIQTFERENLELEAKTESLKEGACEMINIEEAFRKLNEQDEQELMEAKKNTFAVGRLLIDHQDEYRDEFTPEGMKKAVLKILDDHKSELPEEDYNYAKLQLGKANGNAFFGMLGTFTSGIPMKKNYEHASEALDESLKAKEDDFIHKYVYFEDLDENEIPGWCFISKICLQENCSEEDVTFAVEEANKGGRKYKMFGLIASPTFYKTVVAAKEITEDDIMEDYGNYLPGNVRVQEYKN